MAQIVWKLERLKDHQAAMMEWPITMESNSVHTTVTMMDLETINVQDPDKEDGGMALAAMLQ